VFTSLECDLAGVVQGLRDVQGNARFAGLEERETLVESIREISDFYEEE